MDSFWRTWRSKFSNTQLPSVIDGCCNEVDIANRFAAVFEAVCIPNSKDKHEQLCLRSVLCIMRVLVCCLTLLMSILSRNVLSI